MFTAFVFACTFSITQECLRFEDMRGPYATEERCIARIVEMVTNIRTVSPELQIVRTTCVPNPGQPT